MTPPPLAAAPSPVPAAGASAVPWSVRAGVASLWLLTGALVVTPGYRAVGAEYLARLGLPAWPMVATCALEVALGLRVLLGRQTTAVCGLQAALVLGFTVILAALEPMLLVHPFGVLTKNLPFLALVGVAWLVEREGFSPRAVRLLRAGMAVIWVTEGLLPKVLFQQPLELEVVRRSGLVPIDPAAFLVLMGLAQVASGVLALTLSGRPLRALLACQAAALVVLPVLVTRDDPSPWVHPFGPMTKNLPILVGTLEVLRRVRDPAPAPAASPAGAGEGA